MKALQFTEQDLPEVADLPIPEIADDEVLIAARSVGVCHSDIDLLEGRVHHPVQLSDHPRSRVGGRGREGRLARHRLRAR